jgi:Dyp-type peroxidase family
MSETLELDDIQGLVARGYGSLGEATFVLLEIADPALARAWLGTLSDRVTPGSIRPDDRALHVAIAAGGLAKLGLGAETLATFPLELVEGMTTEFRRRILGDVDASDPDGWQWGGPSTRPVDLLLLLYARDQEAMAVLYEEQAAGFAAGGLAQVERLDTSTLTDREHFGFRDGISQPTVEGLGRSDTPANTIKAGEFVLGYQNEYDKYTDRPTVPASADPAGLLPPYPDSSDERDLGRNGSYLVIRQLGQDVRRFWRFVDDATRGPDGTGDPEARTRLAAKMVGRWPNGAPVTVSPDADDPTLSDLNDFGYGQSDRAGLNCPIGAHVRRTHPRDSLDPDPGTDRSIEVDKRHRLLRRGRAYGPTVPPEERLADAPADDEPRGIHFICLCANITRQFEFVQHTWVNNPKFDGMYDDVDPLIGRRDPGGATFTVPSRPVRRRITGIPTFVTVRGGGYFFLPGLRALRYLAGLLG